ncbi:MAG: adenylate/guanylate cyclase domain-containing protein [Candidatus Cloacimonetes bacterium]|nr:adenylate/guanylate cyclase domain-containing protein [Candidatus Cloacimonadota bacterium]
MNDKLGLNYFNSFLDADEENQLHKDKLKLKEGERREVSILFADIQNSTIFGSQLDPEIFHKKLDELMKRFTKCITYYGGFVDKYMGDGIMALFGAKQASEQDTERAILAGLKMIEQFELLKDKMNNDNQAEQIGVRIGINSGLVIVAKVGEEREGDFTVTGTAVNLAQRLETNAPEGKILVSVNAMLAAKNSFEFHKYGMVNAKGFPDPVQSFLVIKQKLNRDYRWHGKKNTFIGREFELTTLNQAFAHVERFIKGIDDLQAKKCIFGICGDAGLGKTRLVYEFSSALGNNAEFMHAAASGVVRSPFNIFKDLLEHEFKIHACEAIQDKKQKLEQGFINLTKDLDKLVAIDIYDQLPLIGALLDIPSNDIRLKQDGMDLLAHIKSALNLVFYYFFQQKLQSGKPVVLILDDLHWMDESSAAVFESLVVNLTQEHDEGHSSPITQNHRSNSLHNKLLIIMMYREDYQPPYTISHLSCFQPLELHPFDEQDMLRLIRQYTGNIQVSEATIEKVKLLSTGNPFYLEEWCNYLSEIPQQDLYDLPVPTTLHALILSRLDMLDSAIRLLLQKASVIGHEFFVDILRWMEEKLYNPIDINNTLSSLENQAFILKLLGFDYSAYFFKHIMTRDVAYQTLLLENRITLHKLAAEAIEDIYPGRQQEFLFQLADHYHRAGVSHKAIFYLYNAAAAAKSAYSNQYAIELYEKLLQWVPNNDRIVFEADVNNPINCENPIRKARILLNLAEIKWLIGKWDESDQELEKACTCVRQVFQMRDKTDGNDVTWEDVTDQFDCYRLRGLSAFQHGNMEQAKSEWDQCLDYIVSQDVSQHSSLLLAIVHGNLGVWYQHSKDFAQAVKHHQLSIGYAKQTNNTDRMAVTFSNLGMICLSQLDYPKSEAYFNQCLDIAETKKLLQLQSIALGNLGVLCYKQGKLDRAMQYYQKKWVIVDKIDDKFELIRVLGNIANAHRDRGEHRIALEFYMKVLSLKVPLGNVKELAITYSCIVGEYIELEDYPAATEIILKAELLAEDFPSLKDVLQQQKSKIDELINKQSTKGRK